MFRSFHTSMSDFIGRQPEWEAADTAGKRHSPHSGSAFCRFAAAMLLLAGSLHLIAHAQSFNPNGYDAVKTMNEILHPQNDLVIVSSHRGLHALVNGNDSGVPENSLQAIGRSAVAGNEEIELDVKLTSDGIPILSHDQTWGREWCGQSTFGPTQTNFNPFIAPGNSTNDSTNPLVTSTSLANTRSLFGNTVLRDTISISTVTNRGCTGYNNYFGVYPPTLQEALDYMTKNKIAMVLALDIRDPATTNAAWAVISRNNDYLGRNYLLTTLFKVPAKAFNTPHDVELALPGGGAQLIPYFQPVFNTSDIEPTNATTSTNLTTFGGTDVNPASSGYGSETAIINALKGFEYDTLINVAAVELQFKQTGGILSSVVAAAKTNVRTGQRESISVFSPYVDYWDPSDSGHTTPLFFKTTGFCCQKLSDFFYNGAPYGQPSDTQDNRPDLNFLLNTGYNSITYDNPADYISRLQQSGRRNGVGRIKGTMPAARATFATCDLYAQDGKPCVAAHSTTRALSSTYNDRLYQVKRASDNTTTDIGVVASTGYANSAAQDTFCANTSCIITEVYDQSGYGNDLTIEQRGSAKESPDSGAVANALPVTLHGNKVYGISVTQGVGYRNNATHGVAANVSNTSIAAPEGMYMVTSGTNVNGACCFDYGNAETSNNDTGNGHMDALNFGTFCGFQPCSGSGPWVEADLENGQYMGNGSNTNAPSMTSPFVTAMLKNNGQTAFALKAGNAQSVGLITQYSGIEPTVRPGYTPMALEGAITLGTGGDNSAGGVGSFFEGAMTIGTPSDAAENAVQANIVAAGYGGNSNPTNGEAQSYTGPSDPNGPGPQDGLQAPATMQTNDLMGSKPAMAYFKHKLYVAFQANDTSKKLFVAATTLGQPYPTATPFPDVVIDGAPGMAVFNHQLFLGFRGVNANDDFYTTSSPTGDNFPAAARHSNIQIGGTPAMTVFNHQLCALFKAADSGHTLHVSCSPDGQTWPAAAQVANVQIGSDPAIAVFHNMLYVAFRANDPSNDVWIASSSDGVTFTSQVLSGLHMGPTSSPALVVSGNVLYYIYGANDLANEMLVVSSVDGSTWIGPKAYTNVQMGNVGPGATAYDGGFTVGFQSNDSRSVLFTSFKATEGTIYTGPNDPDGAGPQDLFASSATQQPNVVLGSKPALAFFNSILYAAFRSDDSRNLLFLSSSPHAGDPFTPGTPSTNVIMGSDPAMASFNHQLYVAFQSNDSRNLLFTTALASGTTFPAATPSTGVQMGSAPALAVFNNKLYVAFQSNDSRGLLFTSSLSSGTTFPAATAHNGISMGSAPAMAVFNNKLYVAFRANDPSNAAWIASSSDGVNFTSQRIPGQTMGGNSSPALAVSNGVLYYIYVANDSSHELVVTTSPDGSTWYGPKPYTNVLMAPNGPGAAGLDSPGVFGGGVTIGFAANDPSDILFATSTPAN